MKLLYALVLCLCVSATAYGAQGKAVEARGKGKYALLTHLAILLATKVGLSKLVLSIALVVSAMKAMVVMAWVLAIFKYVPYAWPHEHSKFPNYAQVHFFYVAATKIFVLKIVYGIIFYVIVTKAWHLLLWLVQYLKEKKHHEHYVEFDHDHYDHHHVHHDHHNHHDYHGYDYDPQPYGGYEKPFYGRIDVKKIYDADGSYSIAS